jgi:hypothetical protein
MARDFLLIHKILSSVLPDTGIVPSIYCSSYLIHIATGTSLQLDFSTWLQMNIVPRVITWEGSVKEKKHSLRSTLLIILYLNVTIIKVLVF